MMYGLDKADLHILELLQNNARITLKDIAAQVYLTSPAVSARIEKMERWGVIEGYHARVNPEVVRVLFCDNGHRQSKAAG